MIFIGVVGLIVVGILWWQSAFPDSPGEHIPEELNPEIEMVSARIRSIDDHRVKLMSKIVITNPFPFKIESSELHYTVRIDSLKVIEDVHEEPFRVRSSENTIIEIPMVILTGPMERVLRYFDKKRIDSARYSLHTRFQLDLPMVGKKGVEIEVSEVHPALRLPELELEELETNILNSDEEMKLVFRISNPNDFSFQIMEGSFSFVIEEEMEVVGEMKDVVHIAAGGADNIPITAEKEWGSLTQSVKDFLFNRQDTRFTYSFNGILDSENSMLDQTQLDLRVQGTLEELADLFGL